MPTNCLKCTVIIIVILILLGSSECLKKRGKTKTKRKVDSERDINQSDLLYKENNKNSIKYEGGRGFFGHGLFALGKVLNFFPVGGERECQPSSYTAARAGICLNQYDCRQRDGRASGDCAHGLGVCCVFEVTCGGLVQNNLTYFLSPGFPELWTGDKDCDITIEKTHAGITQLKIDFVHFTIGQPNRITGECDEDVMTLGEGDSKFVLCGQNHGQHIYYTLPSGTEAREEDELPNTKTTRLSIRMRGSETPRLWLLRLAQLPLAYSAPHDCLQYHTGDNGTMQTFNFAVNGRHLANQEYRVCVRKNTGKCTVRYSPCDGRSFRIGDGVDAPQVIDPAEMASGPGGSGGPGTGFYGPEGQFDPTRFSTTPKTNATEDQQSEESQNDSMQQTQMMPADDEMQEEEGSGAEPQIAPAVESPVASPSILARRSAGAKRYFGYGNYGYYGSYGSYGGYGNYINYGKNIAALTGYGRKRCTDRITIPCENEYFISNTFLGGVCDPHHCGTTLCVNSDNAQCYVDTSVSPFAVSVHFGPPTAKRNPEDNIGACLRYTQLPCES